MCTCRDVPCQVPVFVSGQAEAQDCPEHLQGSEVLPVLGWIQFPAQVSSSQSLEELGVHLGVFLSVCQL